MGKWKSGAMLCNLLFDGGAVLTMVVVMLVNGLS
jgi:hypothetical protein